MIVENENNQYNEEADNESIEGLQARERERLSASAIDMTDSDSSPQNFLRGSVPSDRLRHEYEAQHGALAHWRHNTNKQRDYDDQVLHGGMGQSRRTDGHVQAAAIAYGASTQSPGMGLESENFQVFITGTHQIVQPIATAEPVQSAPAQPQAAEVPEMTRTTSSSATQSDLPLQALATGQVNNYRRKKSLTFTNLLARAKTILSA